MPLQTPSTRSYFTASKPCHQRGLKLLDRCENDSIIGWRKETGQNWPYFSATFYRLVVINSREPVPTGSSALIGEPGNRRTTAGRGSARQDGSVSNPV